MLVNRITHKAGQQPAWETGEIGHLISSASAKMPEKGGPREAASPPAPSRGFGVRETTHRRQLKPSSVPTARQKDRKQLRASLRKRVTTVKNGFD